MRLNKSLGKELLGALPPTTVRRDGFIEENPTILLCSYG